MQPTFTGLSVLADLVAALAEARGAGASDSTVVLATRERAVQRQLYRDHSRGQTEVKHNAIYGQTYWTLTLLAETAYTMHQISQAQFLLTNRLYITY